MDCFNLNYIKVNFTDWGDNNLNATEQWLTGVSNEGTFNCPANLSEVRNESHIPESWTIETVSNE